MTTSRHPTWQAWIDLAAEIDSGNLQKIAYKAWDLLHNPPPCADLSDPESARAQIRVLSTLKQHPEIHLRRP